MKFLDSVLGCTLLITGTCIGAGMLGIPVSTAAAGLLPVIFSFIIVWLFMSYTANLLLEVVLSFPKKVNFITMAQSTLGEWGKRFAWFVYLALFFSLMASYVSGGSTLVAQLFNISLSNKFSFYLLIGAFVLPFVLILYFNTKKIDYFNRILLLGLLITFGWLCKVTLNGNICCDIQVPYFVKPSTVIFALPLLVTSFGYHHLIPTLAHYMHADVKRLRIAILLGGLLPLFIYGLWEWVIFRIVPLDGEFGLLSMLHGNGNPGDLLVNAIAQKQPIIALVVLWFSLFALTSSLLGVSLGLRDFLADGLRISRSTVTGRCKLVALTMLPPIIFTIVMPNGFLVALSYAGVFAAILLIIYPALMAWKARKIFNLTGSHLVPGGNMGILIAVVFGGLVVVFQILNVIIGA